MEIKRIGSQPSGILLRCGYGGTGTIDPRTATIN
jgi:hypothetical protein